MKTFQEICDDAKTRVSEISAEDVWQKLRGHEAEAARNWVLIDVRENDEFRGGHIPGARGIGRGVLEYHIHDEVPDANREIVLYCRGGNRSALAADSLQKMGYSNVHSMTGGWRAWAEKDEHPVSCEGEPIQH